MKLLGTVESVAPDEGFGLQAITPAWRGPMRVPALIAVGMLCVAACWTGCATNEDQHAPAGTSEPLTIGSHGNGVRELHAFLTRYGYFPDKQLAARYPRWRPIVTPGPAQVDEFDEQTVLAVTSFQGRYGLEQSGVVDTATAEAIRTPRCAEPDGIEPLDPTDKFAFTGDSTIATKLSKSVISWSYNTKGAKFDSSVSDSGLSAVNLGFEAWLPSSLGFKKVNSGADITISFVSIDTSGNTFGDEQNGSIRLNSILKWSTAATTPAGETDLETAVMHEVGHALGLDHSGVSTVVMFPTPLFHRNPNADDLVAIRAAYASPQQAPAGTARDIGVGADQSVWIIGTSTGSNGFLIYKLVGGATWQQDTAGGAPSGERISVDPNGIPYIVNDNGDIWRRSTGNLSTGVWQNIRGVLDTGGTTPCANDVGAGGSASAVSVWMTASCAPTSGGLKIFKWNGSVSSPKWTLDSTGGGGVNIAVGGDGRPWVTNDSAQIWQRSSTNPATGAWSQPGGNGAGTDIAVGADNFAYVIGTDPAAHGFQVWVHDQQPANGCGKSICTGAPGGAAAINAWVKQNTTSGKAIGAGGTATPWVVDSAGVIWRPGILIPGLPS